MSWLPRIDYERCGSTNVVEVSAGTHELGGQTSLGEIATASGESFVMQLLREVNRAATEGRPKCKSDAYSIFATKEESTRPRASEKPVRP